MWHKVILSIYGTHTNGWDANTIDRWPHMEDHHTGLLGFYQVYLDCGGRWDNNPILGRLVVRGSTFEFSTPKSIQNCHN